MRFDFWTTNYVFSNPNQALEGFSILLRGGFYRGIKSVGEVLYLSVPIMMTGLSVAFAFKCGLFNIGTPGQYIVGAFASMFIAFSNFYPRIYSLDLCCACRRISRSLMGQCSWIT
ncbi:MAG: hypothetical protein ACLS85_05170 [Coprobacillus cateniformis]